jgi:diguanylate cyclase (GGDEF)-like protein
MGQDAMRAQGLSNGPAASLVRIGSWECDLRNETLTWTDGVYDLFGLARGSTLHRPSTVDLYHDRRRIEMERLRARMISSGRGFMLDAQIRTSAGEDRWMRLIADVSHEHGRPTRIHGSKQDITHEKALWDRLRTLARTDPLTGLANRRAFETELGDLARRRPDGSVAALALIDVDRFGTINDRYGHAVGDECLRQIAARLRRMLADAILVARIGGDRFAALLCAAPGRLQPGPALSHALRQLAIPLSWNGKPIMTGVSIGATLLRAGPQAEPAVLLAEAQSALRLAKATGRGCLRFYGQALSLSDCAAGAAVAFAARPAG